MHIIGEGLAQTESQRSLHNTAVVSTPAPTPTTTPPCFLQVAATNGTVARVGVDCPTRPKATLRLHPIRVMVITPGHDA